MDSLEPKINNLQKDLVEEVDRLRKLIYEEMKNKNIEDYDFKEVESKLIHFYAKIFDSKFIKNVSRYFYYSNLLEKINWYNKNI